VLHVSTAYYTHLCVRASISMTPSVLFAEHQCIWCATHSYATYYIRWVVSRRQLTATHCNTLQHVSCTRKHLIGHTLQHIANIATHPNTLQHTLANYNRWVWVSQGSTSWVPHSDTLQQTTTHRNTLQHSATHCNNWNTSQHIVTHYSTLQHITTHLTRWVLQHNTLWEPHSTHDTL